MDESPSIERLKKEEGIIDHPVLNDPDFTSYWTHDNFLDVHIFANIPFIKQLDFKKPELYEKFTRKKP